MPNFISVIDTNTKNVYRWIRLSADGTKATVNIPRANWKTENQWTVEEVAALFSPEVIVIQKTDEPLVLIDVAPDVLIDVAPELAEIPAESVNKPVTEEPQNSFQESSEAPTPTFFGITNN